jgi:F-type H+-transporting ATPase subunit b
MKPSRICLVFFIPSALAGWFVAVPFRAVPVRAAPQAEVHDDSELIDGLPAALEPELAGLEGAPVAHAAEVHGNTNLLSVDPDLAIFTIIVFLVLLAVLWKFAWVPIAEGLEKRDRAIADQLAAAKAANDQARQLVAQYDQKLALAQAEVRGVLDEARRDAEHARQEIVAAARADARAERDNAIREIESAANQALDELAERSTKLAMDLAGRIVGAKVSAADHPQLIKEAMAGFPRGNAADN